MKITIVQGAFLPVPPRLGGAVEKIWDALGQEFARRGHRVVHVSRLWGDLPARATNPATGVEHRRVPGFDTPRALALLKALDFLYTRRALRVLPDADILVSNTFWLPLLCRDPKKGKLYVHIARFPRWQMRLYGRAARLQTLTPALARAVAEQAPGSEARVRVIPNPRLDNVSVTDESTLDALARARERTVLFVGRIHPEKGVALLLDAFARFAQTPAGGGWRLRVVGPWEAGLGGGGEAFFKELRAKTDAPPLAGRVDWVGFVSEPARLREAFTRASLFVYPSLADKGEASPVAPLEAMGSGCPAIVSDLDCFRGYLVPGETGFVFNHRAADPAGELAETFHRLAAAPDELARIGRDGWRKTREFSLARVADAYLEDFESLLAGVR